MPGKIYIIVLVAIASILYRMQGIQLFFIVSMFALLLLFFRYKSNYWLIFLSFITAVFFLFHPLFYHVPQHPLGEKMTITGKIISIPKFNGNTVTFHLKVLETGEKAYVNYYMKSVAEKEKAEQLLYGMKCSIPGTFKSPQQARNFNSFQFDHYLSSLNIYLEFSPSKLQVENCAINSHHPIDTLQRYRQKMIKHIANEFPSESKGIVIALVFGEKHVIGEDILKNYQSLGIIHLLAVSGLHVGIVSATLYFLLLRFGITKENSLNVILFFLPIYMIIAGASPSVLRSAAMTMIVILFIKLKTKIHPLDGVSVVCLVMLVINPFHVLQLGFQLSFLTSFTLVVSSQKILYGYTNPIYQMLIVTVVAQLSSFPVILYHFYEISPWSILLNLIFIPFISFFVLPLSFVSVILGAITPKLGVTVAILLEGPLFIAHKVLTISNLLPFSTLTFGKPSDILIILYFIANGYVFYCWEQFHQVSQKYRGVAIFVLLAVVHWFSPYFVMNGEIVMIDVGQGDSILIELPQRKAVYLIDTGGTVQFNKQDDGLREESQYDVGKQVVLPYLKSRGIRAVDKLILTHSHADHIGGANALVKQLNVKEVVYGNGQLGEVEQKLLGDFHKAGAKITFVREGFKWKKAEHEFYVISANDGKSSENDRSIVLLAKISNKMWLFTGDLEETGEMKVLENYPNLRVDYLKVGHHGSKTSTSTSFLELLQPEVALISVGRSNRYGHPHEEVTTRLTERQIVILRTDIHGAVRYRFSKNKGDFTWKLP